MAGRRATSSAQTEPWRSRIVGEAEEDPTQLLANPLNWRIHPGRQRDAMRAVLREVGWVQRVIVNQETGHVIDGHLRVEEAISANEATVPVLYVSLTPEEERLVLATLDPLSAMAGQSEERLRALLGDLTVTDSSLQALLVHLGGESGDAYTDTIKVPRYEPTGVNPEVASLRDETKADELRAAIRADSANLPEEVEAFLLSAASRHTVFDYHLIAEFYAHAEPGIQRLMEASALVIVDYEDAIRNGWVRYTDAVQGLADASVAAGEDEDEDAG